jgi:hypothetical protein
MHWDPMTIDEFARYKRADGMNVVKIHGVWWAEVRPCFFRPLNPFQEIAPWTKLYPPKSLLGGIIHVVPSHVPARSCLNFHVYDDLQNYSIDSLSANRRKHTRRGMKIFTDRPLGDLNEFVAAGHDIYKIFYERTHYWYKSNRTRRSEFHAWAKKLYDCPKIVKTGIYIDNKISAVVTSFQVDDIIFGDNLFADNLGLSLNVIDYIMHRFRESSAGTGARYFFSGLPTGKASLDSSKMMRGCKLLRLPAYCLINPAALTLARLLMKDSYHKLLTVMSQEAAKPAGSETVDP